SFSSVRGHECPLPLLPEESCSPLPSPSGCHGTPWALRPAAAGGAARRPAAASCAGRRAPRVAAAEGAQIGFGVADWPRLGGGAGHSTVCRRRRRAGAAGRSGVLGLAEHPLPAARGGAAGRREAAAEGLHALRAGQGRRPLPGRACSGRRNSGTSPPTPCVRAPYRESVSWVVVGVDRR
ncbi:unnamed protein product, partial [Prorocentrum cordatum]